MKQAAINDTVRGLFERVPETAEHFRKLAVIADQKTAEKDAKDYAAALYNLTHGEEITRLKSEIPDNEQRSKQLKKEIAAQEQLVAKTERMIRVADILKRKIPDKHDRDIRKWLDILLGVVCLIAALIVLGMGASNVFSIIMASGTPIFLEQPQLAWMLSGLMPLGAFALEFFKRHLHSDHAKKTYTMTVFALSALLLVSWVVLFALVFGSAGDDTLDFDKLLKPTGEDYLGKSFTVVQLLAELFVGASLFTSAGDLFAKHSPTRLVENPDYAEAAQLLEKMKKDYAPVADIIAQKKARLDRLEQGLTLYLSEQMTAFTRLRARLMD